MCKYIDSGECEPLSPRDCEGCEHNPNQGRSCEDCECTTCDFCDAFGGPPVGATRDMQDSWYNDPDAVAERRQMGLTALD
jgi:hypothetical protein